MYKQTLWISILFLSSIYTQKVQAQSTNLFGGGSLSGAGYYGTLFSLPSLFPELNHSQQPSSNPPQLYSPDNSDVDADYDLNNEDENNFKDEEDDGEDCGCES